MALLCSFPFTSYGPTFHERANTRLGDRRVNQALRMSLALIVCVSVGIPVLPVHLHAQDASSKQKKPPSKVRQNKAMAAYADAANFQTGGAIDLAIEAWQKFIDQYPNDAKVSKAAHYLGVCYMQQDPPEYAKAIEAFDKALEDKKYEVRSESLANLGWCLFAKGTASEKPNKKELGRVIQTFQTLQQEDSKSRFLDRVYFYCGEAEYSLGNPKKAVKHYDALLAMPQAKKSLLRCDALYARGVAQEDMKESDSAIASFHQFLKTCKKDSLVADVQLRLGDLHIMRREFPQAIESFQKAIDQSDSKDDQAYATFRQAFSYVQDKQPEQAAKLYQTLASKYPKSPYASSALMAAAQSLYRAKKFSEAAKRFSEVLKKGDEVSATEAAHWLARIAIDKQDHQQAIEIAEQQIKRGAKGPYTVELQMDLADALALNPKTVDRSLVIFEKVYREHPDDDLAPRALYNAAFSALQMGQSDQAIQLSKEFLSKFPRHALNQDVRFVHAESSLLAGKMDQAVKAYEVLLRATKATNPQRPVYVLRMGSASNTAKHYDRTVKLLKKEVKAFKNADQKSEAYLLIAQAHRSLSQHKKAATAFGQAVKESPNGPRAGEAKLLQGQSRLSHGDTTGARSRWNEIIEADPNGRMAMQAQYKLAELESSEGKHQAAIQRYQQILKTPSDKGLHPYAKFGLGFLKLQQEDFAGAAKTLTDLLKKFPKHSLASEALLTRGICYRNQKSIKAARSDLETFLATGPTGDPLGHALYELALVDGLEEQPAAATKRLERLVNQVPNYPGMDKVLYELAWALAESGQEKAAFDRFSTLASKYPNTALASEAAYFIGQRLYSQKKWKSAAAQFELAALGEADPMIQEKALYRWGWSLFKLGDYEPSEQAFAKLPKQFPKNSLAFDAKMMIGECRFKRADFKSSLAAYEFARKEIHEKNQSSKTLKSAAEQQIRELVLLHGGQSAAQLGDYEGAIQWYDELRQRFPSSRYLPQVFYETGFAYQQQGNDERALKFFGEVAENYRNEIAARSRFMMGEIHFANRAYHLAIPEFQRVMFGFGAEEAPKKIKNWQAKSGFEAGRCSEALRQSAKTEKARDKATKIAQKFFRYLIEKHSQHELAAKAKERLDAMQ